MTHASKITKYRQHTCGREILRPAPTRFATNFIALQSMLGQKDALRAMVTSREWTSSAYAKDSKAKKFVDQVLDSSFWKHCGDIVRLTKPRVRVLRIVDSEDKPAMSFLYRAIYKAREEMIWRFRRNKKKTKPYLEILDRRWDLQLRKTLHAAGYWLNPAIQFNNDEFDKHRNTISGLLDVIERYSHGDLDLQSKLTSEMRLFKNAKGDFGRQTAIHDRNTVMPVHRAVNGIGVFLAHSKKRNRLEHRKLNDLVYVHYNLRLQQRKQLRHQNYDPINFETLDDHSDWVMEESPPYLTNEEVDALHNDLARQINLDDNEDENEDEEAHDNIIGEANQNPSNVDEVHHHIYFPY
ncbi:hypothetical protein QQ045_025114 [Rhodiola kirilowii]